MLEEIYRTPFLGLERTGRVYPLEEVELLPPVYPEKIIAVGLNYRDHAEELSMPIPDEPILFMKPPSSLLPHEGEIVYPRASKRVDYEAELAIICKTQCFGVSPQEADPHILGYCCSNDVTARDLQSKDGQWTRSKSFDTFCPLGPYVVTDLDVSDLSIRLKLNGDVRQDSSTSRMIFSPQELFSFVSQIMTLYPGDVIMTGTPPGVGELAVGDVVEVEIEGIGLLRNRVVAPF
jgi:2-keto-4-pentenoate hydratase/2-oxohepta-3-ene-1,7-dioic acid hydratase in catechol pathway